MYPESAYVNNTWEQASDELTHAFFACATRRAARLLAPHVPTFLYQFSYKLDFPENKDIPELGNYHTSELDFVFAQVWPPLVHTFSPLDLDMVAVFGAYWGNFVATGDPNKGDLAAPRPWRNFVAGADEWNIQLELPLSETARLDEAVCDNAWDPFFAGLRAAGSVRSDVAARYPRLAARAAGRL
jgi:para-nitrobenzyl esterase